MHHMMEIKYVSCHFYTNINQIVRVHTSNQALHDNYNSN